MFPIIAGVAIPFFIVVAMILVVWLININDDFNNKNNDKEVIYPDLTDILYTDELKNDLLGGNKYGAKFVIDNVVYESRHDMENNKIISTEPKGGHISKPGDDGKLHFTQITVNRSEMVVVPTLEGYPRTTAETMLSKLQLKYDFVEIAESPNPYYHPNQVIDSSPKAGQEVKIGDTVTIYIFAKPESNNTAKMPNLIGMTEQEAIKFAEVYSRYKVIFEYTEKIGGDNKVYAQSISEGTISPKDTVVTVYIAVQPQNMPNLFGLTPDEARAMLVAASPDKALNLNFIYYNANESDREYIEMARKEYQINNDMFLFIDSLLALGCTSTSVYDGTSTICFQSVSPDQSLDNTITGVDIVIVQYGSYNIPNEFIPEASQPTEVIP